MGLLFGGGRIERRLQQTFPEPLIPPFPGADVGGRVSLGAQPDAALGVPTVWACVALLSNAVSMLPLQAFRHTAGIPQRVTDPPLLTNPTGDMTQSEWLHMLMVSLLLRGNAYGHITARDDDQRPAQIDLLSPDRVNVSTDRATGKLVYAVNRVEIPADDMWHVRGMTLPGSRIGLSPISYAATVLGVDMSSRTFAQDFFTGGGIPKAILTSDQAINQEQSRTIKDRLMAATSRREPAVLGAGLKYQPISVHPEESQFLATMQANVGQIARYFNVPAGMVGGSEGGSMTYSNMEQRGIDFLTFACGFWLKRIEDAVNPLLAPPQYVAFETSALLRTDAETSAKIDVQLLAGKIKAPSEVRASRNLPPMTEAQKVEADMVPLTVTPMGGAKALPALKAPPGPVAPVPTDDPQGALSG